MYRDVSAIPTTGCNIITSATAITNYASTSGSNIRTRIYELIGNQYVQRTDTTGSFPTNGYCQSSISQLQSNFDYIIPIYHTIAIASAMVLFFLAYKLILHKWWRKS
jgi:hypothetical protein